MSQQPHSQQDESASLLLGRSSIDLSKGKLLEFVGLLHQMSLSDGMKTAVRDALTTYERDSNSRQLLRTLEDAGLKEDLETLNNSRQSLTKRWSGWEKVSLSTGLFFLLAAIVLGMEAISNLKGKKAFEASGNQAMNLCTGGMIPVMAQQCVDTAGTNRSVIWPISVSSNDQALAMVQRPYNGTRHFDLEPQLAQFSQHVGILMRHAFLNAVRCYSDGFGASITGYMRNGGAPSNSNEERFLSQGFVAMKTYSLYEAFPQIPIDAVSRMSAALTLFMGQYCIGLEQGGYSQVENAHYDGSERYGEDFGFYARWIGAGFGVSVGLAVIFLGGLLVRKMYQNYCSNDAQAVNGRDSSVVRAVTLFDWLSDESQGAGVPIRSASDVDHRQQM